MKRNKRTRLGDLLYDRNYNGPPHTYVPFWYERHLYWRTNAAGNIKYLRPDAEDYRFYFGHPQRGEDTRKTKVSLPERRKHLLFAQRYWLQELCYAFGFPFHLQAVEHYAAYIYIDRNWIKQAEARNHAKWHLLCLTGFALIYFFDGGFTLDKDKKVMVALSRVPVDVYLEQKICMSDGLAFPRWIYNLCDALYEHLYHSRYLNLQHIDCISIRDTF